MSRIQRLSTSSKNSKRLASSQLTRKDLTPIIILRIRADAYKEKFYILHETLVENMENE